MNKIKTLPENLINQIAAGEMIERPSSIVKEIVENAIDAGASEITININNGGIDEIVVSDNGGGINQEDLPLALTRHATSKIATFNDLLQIQTMGFRGEALASIASCANLQVISATAKQGAFKINAEGGVVSPVTPAHHEVGTTIIVRDLFFNIPARRQFLKTPTTENVHCLEACKRLALVNFNISFKIIANQKLIWQLPRHSAGERIKALLGEEFINHSREFSENTLIIDKPAKISGILNLPSSVSLGQKDCQYLFVNNRFVRDRTILHALREGYAEMKHDAKNLAFVLFLEIPPEEVDVNVSPHKTEVRFRKTQVIHSLIRHSVHKALSGSAGEYTPPSFNINNYVNDSGNIKTHNNQNSQNLGADFYRGGQSSKGGFSTSQTYQSRLPSNPDNNEVNFAKELFNIGNLGNINNQDNIPDNDIPPLGFAIGSLHNLYIVAQNTTGLVLVEIHAAHERLLFEKLKENKTTNPSQNLIVPWRIWLNTAQVETFREYQNFLAEQGIFAELNIVNDKNQLIINAVPTLIKQTDYQNLLGEILAELSEHGNSQSLTELRDKVLATIACHGAIRGKETLSINQMNALLREMEKYPRSGSCNHGRPSFTIIPLSEIDKFFLRGK